MKILTIIFCLKNNLKYFPHALNSIMKDKETMKCAEIICVDDHSDDGLKEFVRQWNISGKKHITYIANASSGLVSARNLGILRSNTPYLAFLDGDDMATPHRIREQLLFLEQNPGTEIIFGHVQNFMDEDGDGMMLSDQPILAGECPGAMMCRRSVFEKTGMFEEAYEMGYFLRWLSVCRQRNVSSALLESLVLRRRIHRNNISLTSQNEKVKSDILALRRHLRNIRGGAEKGDVIG